MCHPGIQKDLNIFQGNTPYDNETLFPSVGRLRVVIPLLLSPSCLTRKKTARKMAVPTPEDEKNASPPGFHPCIHFFPRLR